MGWVVNTKAQSLYPQKSTPNTLEQDAKWAQVPVWIISRREKTLFRSRNSNTGSSVGSLVAIPAELFRFPV
jgi:hypothetical protein